MKELIVNADDFGLDSGINRGIETAVRTGIVTAASILANGPAFAEAVGMAKRTGLDAGVHLTLTGGRPVGKPSAVGSLITGSGDFPESYRGFLARYFSGRVRIGEVREEWRRQIEKVLSAGLAVSHLDSHQHLHFLPELFKITRELGRQFNISFLRAPRRVLFLGGYGSPLRRLQKFYFERTCAQRSSPSATPALSCDFLLGLESSGNLERAQLLKILAGLPEGLSELLCHPGEGGAGEPGRPAWRYHWRQELAAVVDGEMRGILRQSGIRLRRFATERVA